MTTVQARATHQPVGQYRLSFARQLRSEAIKLFTVRGTWWSVAIVGVLTVVIAFAAAGSMMPPMNPIWAVIVPTQFTMMLAGILGVISVTGEYSTGMIRSTLTADPRRGSVLIAKAVMLGIFMFIVSLLISVLTAVVISPVAAASDVPMNWGNLEDTLLPLVSSAGAMALFAILGVGLGFLVRSGAGAIAITVGILFVLPVIMSLLGAVADVEWVRNLSDYLPSAAVQSAVLPTEGVGLTVGAAWATMVAWPAAALLGGWAVLRSRDA